MPGTFYILFSPSAGKYYVGHTTEPVLERLRKHNSNHKGYTGKFKDWRIAHLEEFADKKLAYAREREVKSWKSQKRVITLVAGSVHPGI